MMTSFDQTTSEIRLIFWDLGDVLVTLDYPQLFGKLCPIFETHPKAIHMALFRTGIFDRVNRGETTPEEFYREVEQIMDRQTTFETFVDAWVSFFQPRPAMGELLAELKGSLPMWLLSNTDPLHHQACQQRFDYLSHLTGQLTSYELGAMKPHADLYQRALAHVQEDPQHVLFFDDKPENIEGAKELGIHAHLFESADQCRKVLQSYQLLK